MTFISSMTKQTENGAIGFATSGNPLVDFFYRLPSYRRNTTLALNDFLAAYHRDKDYALKLLFLTRDIEKGSGERSTFRHIIANQPLPKHLISLIPQFGRFDDLRVLLDTDAKKEVISLIASQLSTDEKKDERETTDFPACETASFRKCVFSSDKALCEND